MTSHSPHGQSPLRTVQVLGLIAAARELAESTSAKWIMLQTYTSNVNAQALYEKLGFEKDTSSYYYYLGV